VSRVLAYLGAPALLDDLLYQADVSLVRQATNSRLMQLLNLGGFGLAAWDAGSLEPARGEQRNEKSR
jgi:glutamine amidotransferase